MPPGPRSSRPDLDELLRGFVSEMERRDLSRHEASLTRHEAEDQRHHEWARDEIRKLSERLIRVEVIYQEELTDTQKIRIGRRGQFEVVGMGASDEEEPHRRDRKSSSGRPSLLLALADSKLLNNPKVMIALALALGGALHWVGSWLTSLHH